jgi:histidine triad (HIT) family protein
MGQTGQTGDTIFGKIVRGEAPAKTVHRDDRCVAFHDVAPQAPFHVLVVPAKPIPSVADAVAADRDLLGHLLLVASDVARAAGHGAAFRLVVNSGTGAGQSVPHLHVHVLAGRPFSWPPG